MYEENNLLLLKSTKDIMLFKEKLHTSILVNNDIVHTCHIILVAMETTVAGIYLYIPDYYIIKWMGTVLIHGVYHCVIYH